MIEIVVLLYSFFLSAGLGFWMFRIAQTQNDHLFAIGFIPLTIYFAFCIAQKLIMLLLSLDDERDLSKKADTQQAQTKSNAAQTIEELLPTEKRTELIEKLEKIDDEKVSIDVDRRTFLKLIGSAGLSVFLMSLFTQKAHAAFFGSLPGTSEIAIKNIAGDQIDPAEEHPTDGYEISEIDDASSPAYYGFLDASGAWYITKEQSDGAYRYVKGASSFSTNWTNRASLTYDYYHNVF